MTLGPSLGPDREGPRAGPVLLRALNGPLTWEEGLANPGELPAVASAETPEIGSLQPSPGRAASGFSCSEGGKMEVSRPGLRGSLTMGPERPTASVPQRPGPRAGPPPGIRRRALLLGTLREDTWGPEPPLPVRLWLLCPWLPAGSGSTPAGRTKSEPGSAC